MPRFANPSPVTFGVPRRPRPIVPREERITLEEHEAARSAIEFGTLKRQMEVTMNAALRAAAEAPDEAGSQAIFDKATQVVSGLQSKNIPVQNAYQAHLEGALAGWQEGFARQANEARQRQTHTQARLNIQSFMEKDDVVGAAAQYEHLIRIDPGNAPLYKQEQADLPFTTIFARAGKKIQSDNPALIQEGVGEVEGMDITGLRGELVEQRHKLLAAGNQQLGFLQKQNYDATVAQIDELATQEDVSPAERLGRWGELQQSVMDQVASNQISGVSGRTALNYLRTLENQWKQPREHAAPELLYEAYDRILGTNKQMSEEQWADNVTWFRENMAGLGMEAGGLYKQLHEQHNASDSGVGAFVGRVAVERGLDSSAETLLGRVVLDRIKEATTATGKMPAPEEVYAMTVGEAVKIETGRAARKEIYAPAHIQEVFADLQIGGRIVPGDPLGGIEFWQDDAKSKAWEKAVARALEGLQGDEPNLLRAMATIKQKYPEAEIVPGQVSVPWTSLPEDVKRRDFEALSKTKVTGGWIWKSYEPVGGWTQDQIEKAHETGMTPEKFGTWLREKGQVRMVPSQASRIPAQSGTPTAIHTQPGAAWRQATGADVATIVREIDPTHRPGTPLSPELKTRIKQELAKRKLWE